MGTQQAATMTHRAPLYRGECWPSPQYPCHQIMVRYSKDQYFSVAMPHQAKQRYPSSSGTTSCNASRITTQNWWSEEV